MKYIPNWPQPIIELTRRNLTTLLLKLDDPDSVRTLIDPDMFIAVRAVEDDEHYRNRLPGIVIIDGKEI